MSPPKVGALVMVEWEDSHHRSGWNVEELEASAMLCRSVGWVAAASKKAIVLTANVSGEQRCGEMTISLRSVKMIKEIKI